MSKELVEGVVIVTSGVVLAAVVLALIVTPQIISDHQRYTTYLEAQRTVLRCRAEQSAAMVDDICGPVPTLESIK